MDQLRHFGFVNEANSIDQASRFAGSTGGEIVPLIHVACREAKRAPLLPSHLKKLLAEIIYNIIQGDRGLSVQGDELDY
jgi:hypothetical protein